MLLSFQCKINGGHDRGGTIRPRFSFDNTDCALFQNYPITTNPLLPTACYMPATEPLFCDQLKLSVSFSLIFLFSLLILFYYVIIVTQAQRTDLLTEGIKRIQALRDARCVER